jgi:uncharacterized protein (TIGR02611 family)
MFKLADLTYRAAKRLVISIVGFTVIAIGIAMLVLPGPAMVVIPLGLAILGVEFAWARRLLHTVRDKGTEAFSSVGSLLRARRQEREATSSAGGADTTDGSASPNGSQRAGHSAPSTQDPGSRTTGS